MTLSVQSLSGGYGATIVVRDVTIDVPPSSVVALLGPNGAGKSTLLRLIAGLLKPQQGTIVMDGTDISALNADARARRGVCLIPEGHGVFPSLTVAENLMLHGPRRRDAAAVERAMTAFPALANRLGQKAGTLSGGQQQMLALSRAYLCNPQIVLVDEASLGLAPVLVDAVFEFLRDLAATGTSLVIVEQFVGRALALADTAYILSRGRIVFGGSSAELDPDSLMEQYFGLTHSSQS
jgi:branched-chain amino acid transport system ATP-binding protein